jgi:hypothetical protein
MKCKNCGEEFKRDELGYYHCSCGMWLLVSGATGPELVLHKPNASWDARRTDSVGCKGEG